MRWRRLLVAAAVSGVWACGQSAGGSGNQAATDTLTRREKDSIVSTLPIPGAGRIRDAQTAVDRANARAQQHDTIR